MGDFIVGLVAGVMLAMSAAAIHWSDWRKDFAAELVAQKCAEYRVSPTVGEPVLVPFEDSKSCNDVMVRFVR